FPICLGVRARAVRRRRTVAQGSGRFERARAAAPYALASLQLTESLTRRERARRVQTPPPASGRRARRMQATERAMREAALCLMSERGYDATSTDDIARAAGVSPRTFFNYFASKDAVVLLPEGVFLELVTSALDARPAGEDPTAAVAAAIMDAFHHFDLLIGPDAAELMRAQLRLMF